MTSPSLAASLALVLCLASMACGGKTTDDGGSPDGGGTTDTGSVDGAPTVDSTPGPIDAKADVVDDDFTRCSGPGTCVAVPRTCCGVCGSASPEDVFAVEATHASAYRSSVCGPGSGCPACFRPEDPFLQAFCVSAHCVAVDLHTDPMTGCATDDDCQLRYADCCEKCGAPTDGLLALRKDAVATYRASVCALDAACPKCAVGYPAGAKAVCDLTKHCAVTGIAFPD